MRLLILLLVAAAAATAAIMAACLLLFLRICLFPLCGSSRHRRHDSLLVQRYVLRIAAKLARGAAHFLQQTLVVEHPVRYEGLHLELCEHCSAIGVVQAFEYVATVCFAGC